MELHESIRLVRKRWRLIIATVVAVVAMAAVATVMTPTEFSASTRLFVSTASNDNTSLLQGSSFTQQRVKSYADVITTPKVLDPVIRQLRLPATAATLGPRVTATVPLDTVLIDIAVRDRSAAQAARIADAVGQQFTATVTDLESTDGRPSPVKVTIVSSPTVPTSPVSPRPTRNLLLGLLLGLVLGVGLAVARDMLDTSVKTEKDLADVTPAAVIGGIAFDPDARVRPLVVQADLHSPRAEAFRALRTNLRFVDIANAPRSIVLTSTLPGEGKTTTTANLALTLAAGGARVCVVEGDLRRRRLLDYLGLEGAVGLSDVLIGQVELDDVLQPFADGNLWALGGGSVPPNPSELLGSAAMSKTLQELETRFDYVILDSPPLLPVTDAAVLSSITGGTVVVVGCGMVNREQLGKALSSLAAVNGHVLGLVLNMLPVKGADSYAYYGGRSSTASTNG
ncbi:MAG TPA: polysaccharide biosynthesis tyrosine autokinase [Dermatophilaceae bacterium]|nr:polysaccharide biosynthesis tyrosine autokinase [Dermatophilaceae bacterium]